MTKYTVTIDETKRTITVDLDGYKGTARCCPTDLFDIKVGTELALERAKVEKEKATKPATKPATKMSLMEAVRLVEALLPKGEMVIVGNGDYMTKEQKGWLRSLIGDESCDCEDCISKEALEEAIEKAYDEGYEAGYDEGRDEGYDNGRIVGTDEGYDEGYRDGYNEGHKETLADILEIIGNID